MSGKGRILACVEYVHKGNRGFNSEFVRLTPLMRWDNCWVPVVNPVEEYPAEGLVYWPRPKGVRLERGQAWIVELENRSEQDDPFRVRSGFRPARQERGQARHAEFRTEPARKTLSGSALEPGLCAPGRPSPSPVRMARSRYGGLSRSAPSS